MYYFVRHPGVAAFTSDRCVGFLPLKVVSSKKDGKSQHDATWDILCLSPLCPFQGTRCKATPVALPCSRTSSTSTFVSSTSTWTRQNVGSSSNISPIWKTTWNQKELQRWFLFELSWHALQGRWSWTCSICFHIGGIQRVSHVTWVCPPKIAETSLNFYLQIHHFYHF